MPWPCPRKSDARHETYTYDPAGQLTSVTGGPTPATVDYGPRGNRTRTTTPTGAVDSTYNPNGSIATLSDGNGTASFAYDAAGRRTAVEVVDSNDDPLAAVTTAYDAAGRTTTVARNDGTSTFSTTRSWDGDGNLTRLVHSTGGFPAVQDFLWDTTGGLPRVVDSYLYGVMHARHDLTNQYLSIELDAGPAGTLLQWYGYDALGSAVDPNDNPNILDGPDTHDPWGTPTPGITTHPTGLYRGEHRYGDLIHLRARQYHPETAQFTTPDPLDGIDGTPTVANPYHYTDNDPLNKTDPSGRRPSDGDFAECSASSPLDGWDISNPNAGFSERDRAQQVLARRGSIERWASANGISSFLLATLVHHEGGNYLDPWRRGAAQAGDYGKLGGGEAGLGSPSVGIGNIRPGTALQVLAERYCGEPGWSNFETGSALIESDDFSISIAAGYLRLLKNDYQITQDKYLFISYAASDASIRIMQHYNWSMQRLVNDAAADFYISGRFSVMVDGQLLGMSPSTLNTLLRREGHWESSSRAMRRAGW